MEINMSRQTLKERFNSRIKIMDSGCHEWIGYRDKGGYGRIYVNNIPTRAHRIAWELVNGPISNELFILHKCDNPPCCNVEHLWLGTKNANAIDMSIKGRGNNQKKTHCKYGHEFNEENTRYYKTERSCKTCHNARRQEKDPATYIRHPRKKVISCR